MDKQCALLKALGSNKYQIIKLGKFPTMKRLCDFYSKRALKNKQNHYAYSVIEFPMSFLINQGLNIDPDDYEFYSRYQSKECIL